MLIRQIRDLTIIDIDKERYLGISCDSCGGIGEKEYDSIKAPAVIVGEQTAKGVLAELLSMGFEPLVLSDGLAVEMNDTGKKIIEGFKNTISQLKNNNIHMTGSTEENAVTVQTSIGTTGIGIVNKENLKYKKTTAGDICVLMGLPLVGPDVLANPDKIMTVRHFEILKDCTYAKEIVPVGSKGIAYELELLADYNNLCFEYENAIDVNMKCSGGPSCSCIVSMDRSKLEMIKGLINLKITVLGTFTSKL